MGFIDPARQSVRESACRLRAIEAFRLQKIDPLAEQFVGAHDRHDPITVVLGDLFGVFGNGFASRYRTCMCLEVCLVGLGAFGLRRVQLRIQLSDAGIVSAKGFALTGE